MALKQSSILLATLTRLLCFNNALWYHTKLSFLPLLLQFHKMPVKLFKTNIVKTNIILQQNPLWNEAVHTSLSWNTTRPAEHLFVSHNSPCLLSLFTHPLSQEGWEQSREFHELYFSSGHSLKMLRANAGYLNGTAVCHLHGLKFSSKPWWQEQRPGKNRSFVLPESGPQVASGKDRPHIFPDPLWRWPCDITCCVKKALWDAKTMCIRASKSHPGRRESFWKKPRFRGLFETTEMVERVCILPHS